MTKLATAAIALALSLSACVTDDVGTPPQPTDGQDDESDDDLTPIDPASELPDTPCAQLGGKGDGPCAP